MSTRHPIIAVTGSSGAGTSTARKVFEQLFALLGAKAAYVDGDAFHAYDRAQMQAGIQRAKIRGENFSHFGPAANHFDRLEALFEEYGRQGSGHSRHYLHSVEEAAEHGGEVGTFTPWAPLPAQTDVLLYEGLHGGVVTENHNIAQHVDLLIGMTPTINLEWVQKIRRDMEERGHSAEDISRTILRRMPDYVNYIIPQFSRTHINFQRVPLVDTSNPFAAQGIPTAEESMMVIRVARPSAVPVDLPYVLSMVSGAWTSRPNTLVVPGANGALAMELVLRAVVAGLLDRRRALLRAEAEAEASVAAPPIPPAQEPPA